MQKIFCASAQKAGLIGLLSLSLLGGAQAQQTPPTVLLNGDTSHPATSTFALGEPIQLQFQASGLTAADATLKLDLNALDEFDKSVWKRELPVVADAAGNWEATVNAPVGKLGFYRVFAKLSNGVALSELSSRRAGYLTYAVVPDPAQRQLYPDNETRFGLQGGFSTSISQMLPYLGVRWVLGGYNWGPAEPERAGQFAEKRAAAVRAGQVFPEKPAATEGVIYNGKPWQVYTIATLNKQPEWAILPATKGVSAAALSPEGEKAWAQYCREAAQAFAQNHPNQTRNLYQVTWEPVYPWGFKGTDEQLVKIYEIAHAALHQGDPKAVVVGPTYTGMGREGLEWHHSLFQKGLGKYLDGFSIHPYKAIPPERVRLVENVRMLRELILQDTGRDLPEFGTEQGAATGGDPAKELDQARGVLRANLIMLGEGYKFNILFYAVDYPYEPGYGFYYNLNPKIAFGSDKVSPKPIAPAYAAQSFLLEGHSSAGAIEWLGETSLGYVFERTAAPNADIVLALWDYGDKPRAVTIPVGATQVEVFDWMGNRQLAKAPDGSLQVTLGPEPIYVRGVSPQMWGSAAQKPLRVKSSRMNSYPGGQVSFDVEVSAPATGALRGTLLMEVDGRLDVAASTQPVNLKAGQKAQVNMKFVVPANSAIGSYPVRLLLREDAKTNAIAADGFTLNVAAPVSILRVEPVFGADGKKAMRVMLQESNGQALKGKIQVAIKGVPETRKSAPFVLAPRSESAIDIAYADIDAAPQRNYQATVKVTTDAGYSFENAFPINFLQAPRLAGAPPLDGSAKVWDAVAPIRLQGREMVVRSPQYYSGNDDLNANLRYAWDADNLYFSAEVNDDVYLQQNTGFNIWKGDCIQLGFNLDPLQSRENTGNLLADSQANRHSEINLALTSNGPESYRSISFDKVKLPVAQLLPTDLKLSVVKRERTPSGVTLIYQAAIPWKTLGLDAAPKVGDRIGIAATVNDMDDPKQLDPSALGLFDGVSATKDPTQFGVLVLGK